MRKKSRCSMADIAAVLHVSPSTVSRALRSDPSISFAVTEKVLAEARRQGYVFLNRKNLVIVLPDGSMSNYDFCMMDAICRQCNISGLSWEIVNYRNLPVIQERLIHGIISLDYRNLRSSPLVGILNLPLVAVNDSPNVEVHSISSDADDGIRQALRHLKKLGHQKIIYLYSVNRKNYCSANRLEAFSRTGGEMNLICRHFPIMTNARYGDDLAAIVREQMNDGFTAVLAEGETIGIHAGSCLQRNGIRIPEELSLITWDIPGVSEHLSPPMTAIRQDFTALAEAAVNAMSALWRGEEPPLTTKIPYLFFERESTARL